METSGDCTQILLDADVIRNFIGGGKIELLPKIFPNRFCIIDRVKSELCRTEWLKNPVEGFIKRHKIEVIKFPDDDYEILLEYAKLKSELYNYKGDGESACLAYARYRKKYISSSNLKDVSEYCEKHNIKNIPTMELLEEAKRKGLMTEKEIDIFIEKCIKNGAKLPAKNWKEYKEL